MFSREEMQASFYGEYKNGLFGKKTKVSLFIYQKHITGTAATYFEEKFNEQSFNFPFDEIRSVKVQDINSNKCLVIEYHNKKSVVRDGTATLVFPNLGEMEHATTTLERILTKRKEELESIRIQEKMRQEQKMLAEEKRQEECKNFFDKCYEFHITKNNNPFYTLQNDGLSFSCIYIDNDKNLNILKIDGETQEESNATIPFDKIHYYEKAGSVHYTTEINGDYSSFGGSITGGTISTGAAVLGGLLFGPMGMATGALLTHKPTKTTTPSTSFNVTSETKRIDDRSVILNYYSDVRQQYIDVEMPADIYNFFQTHLPEKKYGIVLELEKNSIVKEQEQKNLQLEPQSKPELLISDNVDSFENKIKKLKLLHEHGLLSDEEFTQEKIKLIETL